MFMSNLAVRNSTKWQQQPWCISMCLTKCPKTLRFCFNGKVLMVLPGCIWRNTSPLFSLPAQCCKQRMSRVTTASKKHQIHDANADMIPLHHAKPCSLSRVKFACPISNQLDLYIYVPPLSAKLKTVTLWPRKQSSSGSKSRVQEIRCAWSQHAKIKGLVSQMQSAVQRLCCEQEGNATWICERGKHEKTGFQKCKYIRYLHIVIEPPISSSCPIEMELCRGDSGMPAMRNWNFCIRSFTSTVLPSIKAASTGPQHRGQLQL